MSSVTSRGDSRRALLKRKPFKQWHRVSFQATDLTLERVAVQSVGVYRHIRLDEGASAIGQQPAHIQNPFKSFMGLLKYWRDESAHGREAAIDEVEAFTSVVLLIRFAQFAVDNWDALTGKV